MKTKKNAFVINVFLGPLRNPRQSKNKPVIAFQLVVMLFIPLVRCPRATPSGNT